MQFAHFALPLLLAALASAPVQAAPIYLAEVSDPAGDHFPSVGLDILSARVAVEGGQLRFTVRLAPGQLDPATTVTGFHLDVDQNSATGGIWGGLGVDFIVRQGLLGDTGTAWLRVDAGGNYYANVASAPVVYSVDQVDYAFDLSLLGGEEGVMDFDAHVIRALSATTSTGVGDIVRGTTRAVPEPASLALLGAAALAGLSARGLRRSRVRRPAR